MFLRNAPFVTVDLRSADFKHGQAGSTVGPAWVSLVLAVKGIWRGATQHCTVCLLVLAYYNVVMAVWQLLSVSSKPNPDPFTYS